MTELLAQLQSFKAIACKYSPFGIRIPYGAADARAPHIESEGVFQRGHVELQDEGSQLVSLLVDAKSGEQVLDLCAGAGGKTLVLAMLMENKGQIVASDNDKHRLAPIYERIKRAGAHNIQVRASGDIDAFKNKMDKVMLDVPCTGTGAWRRRPDNKWKLSERHIAERMKEQDDLLAQGAQFIRKGGELTYITCSLLRDENEERIKAFLQSEAGQGFSLVDMATRWTALLKTQPPRSGDIGLRLSPKATDTDGFFIAVMQKND